MYERTQRHVCRTLFIALCVVPTVLTLAWVVYFHRPWQERDWQQWAEQTLHVHTNIGRVSAPRPGERTLVDIRLSDLQSGRTLAELDELTIHRDSSLAAGRLTIPWDPLPRLAAAVGSWLATDAQVPSFTVGQVEFVGPAGQSGTVEDLQIQGSTANRGLQLEARVTANTEPLRMAVERQETGKLRMALDCTAGGVPAWILARLLPGAERWSAAQAQGVLQCETDQRVTRGSWRGTTTPLDAREWLGSHAKHRVTAQLTVHWDTLIWEEQRLITARGTLKAGPGELNESLLADLTKLLYCRSEQEPSSTAPGEMVSFDQLACEFELTSQGLTLRGRCPGGEDSTGVVLTAAGQPLLREPVQQNLPAILFVHAFCPQSQYWLPASQEAVHLFQGLPLQATTSQRPTAESKH